MRMFARMLLSLTLVIGAALAEDAEPLPQDAGDEVGTGTTAGTDVVNRADELITADRPREAQDLLERYLIYRPDDQRAKQVLLSARIATLEQQIRETLDQQAKTSDLVAGNADYETARARTDKAVKARLDIAEQFLAQHRYPEAVRSCNAILKDYPKNPAALQLKIKALKLLAKSVEREREALLKDQLVRHDEGINEVIEDAIMPREKAKVARDVFIFDEDLAEIDRQRLRERFKERVDLVQDAIEVRKVIDTLFAIAGMNYIILDKDIGSETVTIHLTNETLEAALDILAKMANINYNFTSQTVFITSTTSSVMRTEIIRISSGLTNVGKKPQVQQDQSSAGQTGAGGGFGQFGGQPAPMPIQNPFGQNGQQTGEEDKSDLEKFLDKVADFIPGWGGNEKWYLEKKSNTLYVMATQAHIDELKRLLHAMDYNSVQVLIEAKFLEVSESAARELGIDWESGINRNHVIVNQSGGLTDTTGATIRSGFGALTENGSPANGLFGSIRTMGINGVPDFRATITALERAGKADTLAEPKILTLNNATGYISLLRDLNYIADNSPNSFNTGGQVVPGSNSVVNNTTTVLHTTLATEKEGITLQVQPSVARNSDIITLRLNPMVRQRTGIKTVTNQYQATPGGPLIPYTTEKPEFDVRQIDTILHVKNGETVALGGLTKETNDERNSGLPFLSKVPVIRYLFGREAKSIDRRNLVILVTARIVDPAGAQTSDEIRRLRDTAQAVLPEAVRDDLEREAQAAEPAKAPNSDAKARAPSWMDRGR
jgi:MSHA biogenesis protein MshL